MTNVQMSHRRRLFAAVVALATCVLVLPGRMAAQAQVAAPVQAPAATPAPFDIRRFEKDIVAFEEADRTSPPPKGGILFVGSSIFRLWAALQEHDAGILPQAPVELTITNIDGIHELGAALQKTIGEASGRTSHIERDAPANIDLKMIERRAQFVPAAADILRRRG